MMRSRKVTMQGIMALSLAVAATCFTAASAVAFTPETPETVNPATAITATSATLHGILNPGAPGEPGSYQFDYAPSEFGACNAAGLVAPSSPALALGEEKEAVSTSATGLEPNREYLFCVVAYSFAGGVYEPAYGAGVPFKTLPLAPVYTASTERASGVTASGATLEAQINPNNEETNYTFEYSEKQSAGKLEGTIVQVSGILAAEFGERTASAPTGALLPDTTYYYRVVAENEKSKEENKPVEGPVESFTTAPEAPETISPAKSITATTAIFEGVLNPKAASAVNAGWHFAYSNPNGTSCLEGPTTASEPEATVKAANESTEVKELQPNAKYTFCLVATNAAGAQSTAGNEVSFGTPASPPTIETETASGVTPYQATLEAQINPNNQKTTYEFEYSTSNTLTGATTLKGGRSLSGYGAQTASVDTGHVLMPGTSYYYRVLTKNEAGEETKGAIEHFTTPTITAPVIEGQSSSVQSPFAATLEATISPDYQPTTCAFEYATSEAAVQKGEGTSVPCAKSLGEGGPGASGSAAVTGLSSNTTYYFRVTATNGTGTTTDPSIAEFTTTTAEAPVTESESVSRITAFTAEFRAKINPNFQATTCEFQYGTDSSLSSHATVPCESGFLLTNTPQETAASLSGLAKNTTYYYRVVASNATGTTTDPTIEEFKTLTTPVALAPQNATVTRTTASVTGGTVNPEGLETSAYCVYVEQAEYETALKDGAENPYSYLYNGRSTPTVSVGEGTEPVEVVLNAAELKPGTTYDYALVATSAGATVFSSNGTFTTSPPTDPIVTTGEAQEISQTSATITGSVDTRELSTVVEFELSTTPGGGYRVPATRTPTGGSVIDVSTSFNHDLQQGTTYYYRVVATNSDGTSYGVEKSFTTGTFPSPPLPQVQAVLPVPTVAPTTPGVITTPKKPLTKAQKLAKALKACKKQKKSKRSMCKKRAQAKYGAKKHKKK